MAYNSKFTGAQIDALLDASEAMQTSKEDAANKVTSINADADDTHYPSAKAVKDFIEVKSRNLFDRSKVMPGFVNSHDGVIMTNPTNFPKASVSPVIDVEPNTYYTISGRTDVKGIVGYDANGNKVQIFEGSWATPDYNGSFIIPSNVVRVQFTCTLYHDFSKTDLIQFEKGEVATTYEEYGSKLLKEEVANISLKQAEMQKDFVAVKQATENATDTSLNILNIMSSSAANSEILFPNYIGATLTVDGNFPNWWGFSTVEDLPSDCFLTGITFSGSLSSDRTFNVRISEKVRDDDGNITSIRTVRDVFEVTLKAGESRIDLNFLPFSKNSVLEMEYGLIPPGLIKYKSNVANGQVWIKFQDQVVMSGSMWDVNVNLVPTNFLSKSDKSGKTLKVLSIGNSFSQDAFGYVPYIFNKCCSDVNLTFGILYYGGASLENHYNFLIGENKEYAYRKSDKGGAWVTTSAYSIQDALADEDWDIIVLQQNGSNAGSYSTFQPYLNNIIDIIFNMVNKPVRFAWHMTEPYSSNLDTSIQQFTTYCEATREVVEKTLIDLVFPSATGLQNARTTTLQTLGDAGNLMHTSNHAQEGIPCYCLALPNVLVLLELCGYKYKGVFGEDTVPTQSWTTSINMPGQNGVPVGATTENCKIAQKCAIMAIKNTYSITDCSEI